MRVLHVIPSVSPIHGGPSRAIVDMERALSNAGIEVATLTTDDDGPGRRYRSGPASPAAGVPRVFCRKWTEFYKVAPGIVVWLAGNIRRFDVVHVHALFSFSSFVAATVAGIYGVPYVVRPLGTLSAYGMRARRRALKQVSFAMLESRILRNAAAVHFTSQSERDEAEKLGVPMRSVVVPLGVSPALEGHRSVAVRQCFASSGSTILFMSRLDPKKNLEGLLHAMAQLRERHPDAVLEVAGRGAPEYVHQLKELARGLGLADSVRWLGHVEDAEKASALARADIFVLPSYSENFGIAPVEAMLAGLPCVLGSGVAIADEVERAGAGLSIDVAAPAVAEAMSVLLSDEGKRRRMSAAARAFAAQEYSLDVMAHRLIALYSGIVPSLTVAHA